MEAIYVAINRKKHGSDVEAWLPEESLDIEFAIEAYTIHAAYAMNWEKDIGSIATGKLADFAIIDTDMITAFSDNAPLPRVLKTFVGGKCFYGCKAAQ